jgi:hypothetical protein
MLSVVDRHVIARESNVVRVDFGRERDPPAPYFPGAIGLRLSHSERDEAEVPTAIAMFTRPNKDQSINLTDKGRGVGVG